MARNFDATVFTRNRQRLMDHDVGRALFDEVVWAADGEGLLSDEHFSVDGTLIEAAASLKSFRPKDEPPPPTDDDQGNPSVDFRGNAGATRRTQHHGSRGAPAVQGPGPGSKAGVSGPCPDGEPPRPADRLHGQPGHRHGRAPGGADAPRWGGRASMRRLLYMATVTAICHNPPIRAFYTRPCAKGKPRKVALVVAMRKLLTVLNTVSQDQVPWQTEPLSTVIPT